MEAKSDSEILANRILRLEEIVRAQNDLLMTLSERLSLSGLATPSQGKLFR